MLLITLGPFIIALLIAILSIPVIIRVADAKNLMDAPDQSRKLHKTLTPTLGGIAIFAGTVFAYASITDYLGVSYEIKYMIPALLLLFFAGIKDDILDLSPLKKLLIQFSSAALLSIFGTMRITNLWGMFGILDISPAVGMALTFLIIVATINAFNLIDGVNGLAAGLGLIASLFFGSWFALTGSSASCILSFSLAGALLGFLYFNFRNAKIFMGDTGSMIIGFIISILAVRFIEGNRVPGFESSVYYIKAAPGVAVAAFLIPLLDMTRVFFLRLLKGKSPFAADRSHIHHILLDLGLSHIQVSISLYAASFFFIGLALHLKEMRSMNLVLILIGVAGLAQLLLISKLRSKRPHG